MKSKKIWPASLLLPTHRMQGSSWWPISFANKVKMLCCIAINKWAEVTRSASVMSLHSIKRMNVPLLSTFLWITIGSDEVAVSHVRRGICTCTHTYTHTQTSMHILSRKSNKKCYFLSFFKLCIGYKPHCIASCIKISQI